MMRIENLRCESMLNPLGISVVNPRLSWNIRSDRRGVLQRSFRVTVREGNPENGTVIFDSGEQEEQNNYVILPPVCGESGTRYFWHVAVRNNYGEQCGSIEEAWFETGLLQKEDWKARWIEPEQIEVPVDVRENYGYNEPKQSKEIDETKLNPCLLIRKSFLLRGGIKRARAYATAHGVYRLIINGKRVGDYELAPEVTPYQSMLQVQTYDITDLLTENQNILAAELANGWWAGRIGHYGESCQYGNRMALLCQLVVEYKDGSSEIIGTDDTFRSSESPRRYSEIGIGEKYDKNMEKRGWDTTGYDDSDWHTVKIRSYKLDNLTGQNAPHMRVVERLADPMIYFSPRKEKIIDFGQVLSGSAFIHLRALPGAVITMRYFEETDKDGNYWFELDGRNSQQTDTFVMDESGEGDYDPRFTYHGFRYIYISCDLGDVEICNAEARLISSCGRPAVRIRTSNEKVNRLQENINWTLRSNMTSILTDNPDRERAGWTGDLQMIAPALFYNADAEAFVRRWLKEAAIEQRDDGSIPLVVPNWPHYQEMPMETSAGWGDVAVIVPWIMYERYGDKRILEESWPMMQKWISYIRTRALENPDNCGEITPEKAERLKYLWNADFNFGDWLTPSACYNEETGEYIYYTQTLCYMMGTYYYAYSASIMAKTAEVLCMEKEQLYYTELTRKIRHAAIEEIYKNGGILESEYMGAQILALHMGFYPEEDKEKLIMRLTELFRKKGMDAGFSSALLISDTFCDNGYPEMAYDILLNESFPSWLYEVNQGATSVWESMQAIMPDGTRNAVSFIQPALCSIGNWMVQGMGGIRPLKPGFETIGIRPYFTKRLSYVETEYDSVQGKIFCRWQHTSEHVVMDVEIPGNTTALITLPGASLHSLEKSGEKLLGTDGILSVVSQEDALIVETGAGTYHFEYAKNNMVQN